MRKEEDQISSAAIMIVNGLNMKGMVWQRVRNMSQTEARAIVKYITALGFFCHNIGAPSY